MAKDKNLDENKQSIETDKIQKALTDKAKPKCKICGKYTDRKTSPQCFGHGGGGGGGRGGGEDSASSEASNNKNGTKELSNTISKQIDMVAQSAAGFTESSAGSDESLQLELRENPFNPGIISELLLKGILLIDNDKDLGTLTFKLIFKPKDLSPEQRIEFKKYIDAILKELEEFKKEKGILNNCKLPEQDKQGNILSLRIALPQKHYQAFIQRLASKNLLPIQNIEQKLKDRVQYPEGANLFNITPYAKKPTPYANRKSKDKEAREIDEQSTSPVKKSSILGPKSPLEGLKPKSWK